MINLQLHSRRVDKEVDIIRMTREADYAETLHVISNMKAVSLSEQGNLPAYFAIRFESTISRTIERSLPGPHDVRSQF